MGQWNIELTLSTVCDVASTSRTQATHVGYPWLCKLVEGVIKKHRLRLEGHHHLLLTTLQALLRALVVGKGRPGDGALLPRLASAVTWQGTRPALQLGRGDASTWRRILCTRHAREGVAGRAAIGRGAVLTH